MKLNRRDFLKTAAAPALAAQPANRRPNIVFFFADDWGRYASVYRDGKHQGFSHAIKTPNIDRVAREGVLFTNAFMAVPSCTPSRAAVATGCYAWRSGSTSNLRGGSWKGQHDPGNDLPGFGTQLEKSGYRVRASYKTFDKKWLGGEALRKAEFHRYSQYVSAAATPADAEARKHEIATQARNGIKWAMEGRSPGQPFFYVYGPINTHRPWIRGSGKQLWGIDPDNLSGRIPAFLPDNAVVREDVADYLGEVQALDMMVGRFLDELQKAGELENTLLVLAGDNGMGGMPRGKCNLYDFGVRAPLIARWPGKGKPGRIVDDFVNLMDLAPTFVDAAGLTPPAAMNGRSLVPLLASTKSGTIDPSRDYVVTSRERHVPEARAGSLPYPSRAIRTRDFLYIRNFKPDRNPMGDPVDGIEDMPFETLAASDELLTYKDMDASPTKAWILKHRDDKYYQLAFGKRPAEELYDLSTDPGQVTNVATDLNYAKPKAMLADRLMKILRDTNDPRLTDAPDRAPYIEA